MGLNRLGDVVIKIEHIMTIDSLSLNFYHASMDFSIDNTEIFMIDEIEIQSYLLMFTEWSNDEIHDYLRRKALNYCIDSNWWEMDQKNNLIFTKSLCCDYR